MWVRAVRTGCLIACAALLLACSSASKRPEPTPLAAFAPGVSVEPVWQASLDGGSALLRPAAVGESIAVAGSKGQVQVRLARSGTLQWQLQLPKPVLAGVGFDGRHVAVIDADNGLVLAAEGRVLWRLDLQARSYTAPLLAGGRVFVLDALRRVRAFDVDNGAALWSAPFTGEALVLQAPGLLAAYGNSLLVGWGERLVGLNPDTGKPTWSAAITLPRGVNEIERLTDLVAGAHAAQGMLCARAFGAAVSCVDVQSGQRRWSQDSDGVSGVAGDDAQLIAVDRSGRIQSWTLDEGKPQWTQDSLRYRQPSAAAVLGLTFAVGDVQGQVHWFSKSNGALLNRLPTDGSAIVAAPLLADGTLIAQTTAGAVFAWQPK